MKNLLLTFVVFSFLLLICCQENPITEPDQNVELQKNDYSLHNRGAIQLDRMLVDPYPVMNSYFIINGEIHYDQTSKLLDPTCSPNQYSIFLKLSIYAKLFHLCTVCGPEPDDIPVGTISTETNYDVSIFEGGTYQIVETFPIQGRDDGMILVCTFNVTSNEVNLSKMSLHLSDTNSINNDVVERY